MSTWVPSWAAASPPLALGVARSHAEMWMHGLKVFLQQAMPWCRALTRLLRKRWEAKLPRSWGGHFRNDHDHRNFTAIGAAAGLASPAWLQDGMMLILLARHGSSLPVVLAQAWRVAFAAPLSGMVFIVEESAATLGAPLYYRALVGNCAAVLALNLLVAGNRAGAAFWDARHAPSHACGPHRTAWP